MDWPERARLFGAILLAAALAAFAATAGRASSTARSAGRPVASHPRVQRSQPVTTPPLRDAAPVAARSGAGDAPDREPLQHPPALSGARDPVVQSTASRQTQTPDLGTWEGISGIGTFVPPDPNGEIGSTQYVEMVNSQFEVFDKTTGASLLGPVDINTLWQSAPGLCRDENDGDPVVTYDQVANRWLISQFAFATVNREPVGPYFECIAISTSDDATGSWHIYAFQTSTHLMDDYPKFGMWPDATNDMYVMTYNTFDDNTGGFFAGAGTIEFNRAQMLSGSTATFLIFDPDTDAAMASLGGLLPSDFDGSALPPAGEPATLAGFEDDAWGFPHDQLELDQASVDWAHSAGAITAMSNSPLVTASFNSTLCADPFGSCVPQPGVTSGDYLDGLSDRLMFRLDYRNIGGFEHLVVNHTVNASSGRAGIRWYDLRKTAGAATPWLMYQQSTFAPADTLSRWMGSIAMDGIGDLALGYSASGAGSGQFPSIRFTTRLWSDTLSTMRTEQIMQSGAGVQINSFNRWGDYSDMTVDPTDGCTFYYVNEYLPAGQNAFDWRTRIGHFQIAGCAISVPTFSPAAGNAGTVVTLTGSGFAPGATTVTFNGIASPSVTVQSPTQLTAVAPTGVTAGPISVTSPTGTATTSTDFQLSVSITSVTPDPVQVGDTVTVDGSGFTATPTVTVGSTPATVTSASDTSLQFTVPDGALTAPITVDASGTRATTTGPLHVRPTVVLPASHGFARGVLTLAGAAFTGTSAVTLAGTNLRFTVLDYHHLRVALPLNAVTGQLAVTNAGGATGSAYTIDPLVSSFTPTRGRAGASVRLSGSGFGASGDTRVVKLNGQTVAATWLSPNSLRFTVPLGATSGQISVAVNGGTPGTSGRSFTVG